MHTLKTLIIDVIVFMLSMVLLLAVLVVGLTVAAVYVAWNAPLILWRTIRGKGNAAG